jgi:competence protein ComEA
MRYIFKFLTVVVLALGSLASWAQAVNINTATAQELEAAIKGIGPKKAAEVIKYRTEHGQFQTVEDLLKVPGIGEKTLQNNKDKLTVGGAAPAMPGAAGKPSEAKPPAAPATAKPAGSMGGNPAEKAPATK